MKNFKFGNKSRDRKDSSRRSFRDRDSKRPLLYDAVCDECGKNCKVPFKPSGDKPVYCSDCFEKKGGRDSNRPSRRDSQRRNFGDRDSGRSPQNNISNRSILQLVEKIGILNTKLDAIINLISAKGGTEKNKKSESTKANKTAEALTLVKEKDADLTVDSTQKNIKSKPKKRAKAKVGS